MAMSVTAFDLATFHVHVRQLAPSSKHQIRDNVKHFLSNCFLPAAAACLLSSLFLFSSATAILGWVDRKSVIIMTKNYGDFSSRRR